MITVSNDKKCKVKGCNIRPNFNYSIEKQDYIVKNIN